MGNGHNRGQDSISQIPLITTTGMMHDNSEDFPSRTRTDVGDTTIVEAPPIQDASKLIDLKKEQSQEADRNIPRGIVREDSLSRIIDEIEAIEEIQEDSSQQEVDQGAQIAEKTQVFESLDDFIKRLD